MCASVADLFITLTVEVSNCCGLQVMQDICLPTALQDSNCPICK